MSKFTITEIGRRATQYKKIVDMLPVLCVDKNYKGIDDILCNGINLVKADFIPAYPDAKRWSNTTRVTNLKSNPPHSGNLLLQTQIPYWQRSKL